MSAPADLVFLFDVDNTLLDNDAVQRDLRVHLAREIGATQRDRYFEILEQLRSEIGYVNYLGALERYRLEHAHEPRVLRLSSWMVDYPFEKRLYPGALAVLERAGHWGRTAILSDGDAVFQPLKVDRSGLWNAVGGRVLIYVHKEEMLADVERLHPARHYVMIDDKLRILTAIKRHWGKRVTTVFPRQGHYALDPHLTARYPEADVSVAAIAELLDLDLPALLEPASRRP